MVLVDEIQALAAMTIGTAVGNLGEFRSWALEDVSDILQKSVGSTNNASPKEATSALSLLVSSFEQELTQRTQQMGGGTATMAVVPSTTQARYKSRGTYKLRAIYALGSLLRGNPLAQQYFIMNGGPEVLVRDVLGTLSTVRGPSSSANKALMKLDYKFASKVLTLGEDVAMDVVLHEDEYIQLLKMDDAVAAKKKEAGDNNKEDVGNIMSTSNQLVAAFTTDRWCDLSLRMLSPPADIIGEVASRGIKERALSAVRALGPGCIELEKAEESTQSSETVVWGVEEVKRVRSEWNKEGSGDGLDSVYRRELLDLVDGVLSVLQ